MNTYYHKRITTYEELDGILPMLEDFHKTQHYCTLFPHSGYLAWLTSNFYNLAIWVVYTESNNCPVGYAILQVQPNNGVREALIYEAYSDVKDMDATKRLFDEIQQSAKNGGCQLLSCYTDREKDVDAFCKRYGFEVNRVYLTKRL